MQRSAFVLSMRKKANLRTLFVAVLFSALVHLLLVFTQLLPLLGSFWEKIFPPAVFHAPAKVAVVSVPRGTWDANRLIHSDSKHPGRQREEGASPPRAASDPEKPKEEKQAGQVVEVAPSADRGRPDSARFLAERDSRVEKESISRFRGSHYPLTLPVPTQAIPGKLRSDRPQPEKGQDEMSLLLRKKGQPDAGAKGKSPSTEAPSLWRKAFNLKLDMNARTLPLFQPDQEVKGNSDRGLPARDTPGGQSETDEQVGDQGADDRTLAMVEKPSTEKAGSIRGGPFNDYVKDVPEGDGTFLNTREFRYATFFNRVKRGVSSNWNPGEVYTRHDPYGSVYGNKDRLTVIDVALVVDGSLAEVKVAQSCGLSFLDDEAVSAFQKAAPFPNPPKGLLESDGNIRFQFSFYFEVSNRPRLRASYPGRS